MATLLDGATFGTWSGYTRYAYLTGSVSRSGNTVTLSNLAYYFKSANAAAYGYNETLYIRANNGSTNLSSTSVRWQFTGGTSPTVSLNSASVSVGASTTSYTFYLASNDGASTSFTVNFPSGGSAPTGLTATNVTPRVEGFSATVSITNWGGVGDINTRRKSMSVRTYNASSLVEPRVYFTQYGNNLSDTIIVDNTHNSGGTLVPVANTRYTLSVLANNGTYNTGHQRVGDYVTLPYSLAINSKTVGTTSATINYTALADGGFYDKTLEYTIDGGTTWESIGTVTGGAATTGSFTISGLSEGTQYTLQTRVTTTAGTNTSTPVQFTTKETGDVYFYGPVEDVTKKAQKIYGSNNGDTALVGKIYGSVNGEAVLVHRGFGPTNSP